MGAISLTERDAEMLLKGDRSRILCIDTETTGLNPSVDEVLSLSIVNGNEEIIFDHLVKPTYRNNWPDATRVNGISPQDVIGERRLPSYLTELSHLASSCDLVIGYNLEFDITLLDSCGCHAFSESDSFDVMAGFSFLHGNRCGNASPRRFRLSECARYYEVSYKPHSSLEDALATLKCFFALLNEFACKKTGDSAGLPDMQHD